MMNVVGHKMGNLVAVGLIAIAAGPGMAQQRAAVPDAQTRQASQKAAGQIYGERFQQAKTVAEKTAVATEMIQATGALQDGSAGQYVLLTIAADIAATAGDAPTAMQAVERIIERFDVEDLKLTIEILLAAARGATATDQHREVGEAALAIADRATDAREDALVLSLCQTARSGAQRTRQFPLARELALKIEKIEQRQSTLQEYWAARQVLEQDPIDPAANLAAGRYLCFVEDDWERGVAMLALGSDADLKAAAVKDLRGADSAEQQAVIGDAWWQLAEGRDDDERAAMLQRAGYWYQQAQPDLAGELAGLRVKQRLEEIAKLDRQLPAASSQPGGPQAPPLAIAPFDARTAKRHQAAWARHLGVPVVWTNSIGMRFVLIPPGEFDMGSTEAEVATLLAEARSTKQPGWYINALPAEAPKHRVRISQPFYLGMFEVTQDEYERMMGTNPSRFKGDPRRPVEMVSWEEAVEFCRRLSSLEAEQSAGRSYRLSTEAEWEYACRAGTTTTWHSGDHEAGLKNVAWYGADRGGGSTYPVGQKNPNAWGLYDMYGNVSEWCYDWHDRAYYRNSPLEDPAGPTSGSHRVRRGGGWYSCPRVCRSAYRDWGSPTGPSRGDLGFRVALVLADESGR